MVFDCASVDYKCFLFSFYALLVDVLIIPIDEQRSLQGDETSTMITMDF